MAFPILHSDVPQKRVDGKKCVLAMLTRRVSLYRSFVSHLLFRNIIQLSRTSPAISPKPRRAIWQKLWFPLTPIRFIPRHGGQRNSTVLCKRTCHSHNNTIIHSPPRPPIRNLSPAHYNSNPLSPPCFPILTAHSSGLRSHPSSDSCPLQIQASLLF